MIGAEPGLAVEVMAIWARRGSPTLPSVLEKVKVAFTASVSNERLGWLDDIWYLQQDVKFLVLMLILGLLAASSLVEKSSRQFIKSCL